MRILHIVENYSLKSGGIRTVVKNLNNELSTINHASFIVSAVKEKEDEIFVVDCKKNKWLFSKKWKKKLQEIHKEKQIDCIHIHGVWMFPQYIAAKFSIQNNIPFILSPHGMYEPWLWTKGTLKKKIYFHLLVKKNFSKATIIHAITKQEKTNLKSLFSTSKIVEIPNLIRETNNQLDRELIKEKYILYIGRLDTKKGIDLLINAFIKINPSNFKLKIAGTFNSYKKELDKFVTSSSFDTSKIEFLGFVEGNAKQELIKDAFILVAPSHSEVIGMVNLEAAILKTPVITTYQTGLDSLWNKNGGFLIDPTTEAIIEALKKVLLWTDEEQLVNGNKLYDFVSQNYSWKFRLNDWEKLYKSIL